MSIAMRLPRLTWGEVVTVLRLTGRVLADSDRTLDIVQAEEIVGQEQLRALRASGWFAEGEGRSLLEDRPRLVDVDLEALADLPAHTLGGAFARHLDRNGLDYKLTDLPARHTADPELAYLLNRLRQSHDLWHALLGLGTKGYEEVLIHAFSLGQTGMPTSLLIAALGGIKHLALERRWTHLHPGLARAYEIGRQADPLLAVRWEDHWHLSLEQARRRWNVTPYGEA